MNIGDMVKILNNKDGLLASTLLLRSLLERADGWFRKKLSLVSGDLFCFYKYFILKILNMMNKQLLFIMQMNLRNHAEIAEHLRVLILLTRKIRDKDVREAVLWELNLTIDFLHKSL